MGLAGSLRGGIFSPRLTDRYRAPLSGGSVRLVGFAAGLVSQGWVSAAVVRQQAAGGRAPVRQTWPRSWPVRRDCCAAAARTLCTSGGMRVESLPLERKAELSTSASLLGAAPPATHPPFHPTYIP